MRPPDRACGRRTRVHERAVDARSTRAVTDAAYTDAGPRAHSSIEGDAAHDRPQADAGRTRARAGWTRVDQRQTRANERCARADNRLRAHEWTQRQPQTAGTWEAGPRSVSPLRARAIGAISRLRDARGSGARRMPAHRGSVHRSTAPGRSSALETGAQGGSLRRRRNARLSCWQRVFRGAGGGAHVQGGEFHALRAAPCRSRAP